MLVLIASRSGKVCTRMGTEHHVHVVSRRGGIPAFLGIHKQASHLLGEAAPFQVRGALVIRLGRASGPRLPCGWGGQPSGMGSARGVSRG